MASTAAESITLEVKLVYYSPHLFIGLFYF